MKLNQEMRVDSQSTGIFRDRETSTCVDYFFVADLWCKDPRYASRYMKAGECRGLLRFDKETLAAELLFPMTGDEAGSRFNKAVAKILEHVRTDGCWPDRTQFASG